MDKKFYFITFQATNNDGTKQEWNQVTDKSPMEFIDIYAQAEKKSDRPQYHGFVVLNTLEISEGEYWAWKDML